MPVGERPNIQVIWGDDVGQEIAVRFAATFEEFPPIQKAASFTIDEALAKMAEVGSGRYH
jgi:hypothetical protein